MLQELTGVPTVATLPMWWQHGLPEEDGVFDDRSTGARAAEAHTTVAVMAYPRISNLDEFQPLKNVPGVRLRMGAQPGRAGRRRLDRAARLQAHQRRPGLAARAGAGPRHRRARARGGAVLGICGGLQMLGEALIDPHGIDGNAPGLGLLPLVTVFEPAKTVRRTQARLSALRGAWAALSGVAVRATKSTTARPRSTRPWRAGDVALMPPAHWPGRTPRAMCWACTCMACSRTPACCRRCSAPRAHLDTVFEGLADFIDAHFEPPCSTASWPERAFCIGVNAPVAARSRR